MRDVKSNKKDFSRYIGSKRYTRENASLLMDGSGDLVTKHTEKTKVLNMFFTFGFQQSQAPETEGKDLPSAEQGQVREHLNRINRHKSVGPDRRHLQVQRDDQCHYKVTLNYL